MGIDASTINSSFTPVGGHRRVIGGIGVNVLVPLAQTKHETR
jgi:hypothetical protein